jgi:hypothetical protein
MASFESERRRQRFERASRRDKRRFERKWTRMKIAKERRSVDRAVARMITQEAN